jgi:hypothetical protein
MRYGFVTLLCAFVVVTGMVYVFAQDRPPGPEGGEGPGGFGPRPGADRGDRQQRPDRAMRQQMPGMGAPAAMELAGNTLFLVSGTKVFKVNTTEMKLEAERDLAEADAGSTPEEVLKKLDANGDGKVSREEWTGPPQAFDRIDSNSDGAITKEEIPAELVDRARRLLRSPVRGGPAAIKVATTSLYVYLGGKLYKLKVSDLAIEGSLEIETPGQRDRAAGNERRRAKRRDAPEGNDQGNQPERPRKKKDDDDFGF